MVRIVRRTNRKLAHVAHSPPARILYGRAHQRGNTRHLICTLRHGPFAFISMCPGSPVWRVIPLPHPTPADYAPASLQECRNRQSPKSTTTQIPEKPLVVTSFETLSPPIRP